MGHSWAANAKELYNRVVIYFAWDGDGDKASDFGSAEIAVDLTSQANWGETRTKEIKDKWTLAAQLSQVEILRTNILTRYANPPEIVPWKTDRRYIYVEAGDIVVITTERAPSSDMKGISGKRFQVVKRNLDFNNDTIQFELLRV